MDITTARSDCEWSSFDKRIFFKPDKSIVYGSCRSSLFLSHPYTVCRAHTHTQTQPKSADRVERSVAVVNVATHTYNHKSTIYGCSARSQPIISSFTWAVCNEIPSLSLCLSLGLWALVSVYVCLWYCCWILVYSWCFTHIILCVFVLEHSRALDFVILRISHK